MYTDLLPLKERHEDQQQESCNTGLYQHPSFVFLFFQVDDHIEHKARHSHHPHEYLPYDLREVALINEEEVNAGITSDHAQHQQRSYVVQYGFAYRIHNTKISNKPI